ncbi:MAG: aldo/keto reductase [Clostridia bacterium]|nr:aldo/keto reductase [Clostridia bacterium]
MVYRDFQGLKLSQLGFGGMRLPTAGGDSNVDKDATREMIAYAMKNGINYYDTAWGYHDGTSESIMGEILSQYPRDSFYLATKFPGYDLSNMPKVEEIFEEQLKKCRVEYFDFYLFHNVCELNIDAYLNREYGIYDYLLKQKRLGRIRHLGFSAHGSVEVMKRFLDAYGKDMEFCQIQLNYVDWTLQQAEAKVALLNERNIPIWVMEPVRGGKLAKLGDADAAALEKLRPGDKPVEWAFRFLQGVQGVCVTLSGMSNMEQLVENIDIFKTESPLNGEEKAAVLQVAKNMITAAGVPCTACHYCTSHCPQGLDIPWLIELYNEHRFTGGGFLAPMALGSLDEDKRPSACLACGACQAVCPQNIKIPEIMSDFAARLGS